MLSVRDLLLLLLVFSGSERARLSHTSIWFGYFWYSTHHDCWSWILGNSITTTTTTSISTAVCQVLQIDKQCNIVSGLFFDPAKTSTPASMEFSLATTTISGFSFDVGISKSMTVPRTGFGLSDINTTTMSSAVSAPSFSLPSSTA